MKMDQRYMQRCIDLAILGAGSVSPNPMVGAVIVYQDLIIGEGYTSPYGGAHAEVNAVAAARARYGEVEAARLFAQSTIYVSLEPCAHFGKTPPCAELLVSCAFQRVVIACLDPFAQVNGKGLARLQQAGIATTVGVMEREALALNRRFFTKVQHQRPYVILKWAQTEDGFFAPAEGAQRWISSPSSQALVHKWRAEEDAILVGTQTALIDNPALTVRAWKGKNPKRVLVDRHLKVPSTANIFSDEAETIVFNAHTTQWQSHKKLIALENFDLYLPENILYQLYMMDVQSLIVEGGAQLLQSFIRAGLWDEARVISAPTSWGQGMPAPQLPQRPQHSVALATDRLDVYINRRDNRAST